MSIRNLTLLTIIISGSLIFSCGPNVEDRGTIARTTLHDAKGKVVATAILVEVADGMRIELSVSDMSPGQHAFHIHETGKCEPPDFKSAGAHYNPHGKQHGIKNPKGSHAGDLPTITVGPHRTAEVSVVVKGVTLKSGSTSLFDSDGSSLVIHASPDDDLTDPAGNAGARIACGVIEK